MALSVYTDEYFMQEALKQAQIAFDEGEVPVGAVVVYQGKKIIARAYNQTEKLNDVTAHAEMLAITSAANYIGAKYLQDCALYVTLEPCLMCAGAMYWAQLPKIVYGAQDAKRGFSQKHTAALHPKAVVVSDVLGTKCAQLLTDFFNKLRS
jgi:tRNA(adenine34) deaminase